MTNLFVRINGMDRHMPVEDRTEFVESLFADFIKPDEMVIKHVSDRQFGGHRNFCFVEVNDKEKAEAAVDALDNTTFDGCSITVNVARPREFSNDRKDYKNHSKPFRSTERQSRD